MTPHDVVIVTGANSGIGKATAHALAATGAHVVLACRSVSRGQAALEEISSATGSTRVELMQLDLSSFESVRSFAHDFRVRYDRLSCLILNAGVILRERQLSTDGYEMQFAVNHLGHFLLTRELLPFLEASARLPRARRRARQTALGAERAHGRRGITAGSVVSAMCDIPCA